MSETVTSKQVADQCRTVAHLATALATVHTDYAKIIDGGAMSSLLSQIGKRSYELMEQLGDALNDMDAASETDDWTHPIFEEAHRLFGER